MRNLRILATLLLTTIALLAAAQARETKNVPATVVLKDSYRGFTATFVSARHGKFDVSVGESHEGDPGFEGNAKGSPFEYTVVIYHMEPGHAGLPYVSTMVPVAKGTQGVSLTPLFKGTKKVSYKGVTFYVTPKNLTWNYGSGNAAIEVRAADE